MSPVYPPRPIGGVEEVGEMLCACAKRCGDFGTALRRGHDRDAAELARAVHGVKRARHLWCGDRGEAVSAVRLARSATHTCKDTSHPACSNRSYVPSK